MKAIFLSFPFIFFHFICINSRSGCIRGGVFALLLTLGRLAFSGGRTCKGKAHAFATPSQPISTTWSRM
jgi:hypothetical protein